MRSDYAGDLWTCDACERQIVVDKDEPVPGYNGVISDGMGNGWSWYACKKSCVTKAIWAAGQRDD